MRNCLAMLFVTGVLVAGVVVLEGCSSPGAASPGEEAAQTPSTSEAGDPEATSPAAGTPGEAASSSVTDPGAGDATSSSTTTATPPDATSPDAASTRTTAPATDSSESSGVVSAEGAHPGGAQLEEAAPVHSSAEEKPSISNVSRAQAALLSPSLAAAKAPDLFKIRFTTTKGEFVLEVRRDWAPNGADRLYNLAKIGFFNDVAFFRVMKNFVVQFGIHGDPEVSAAWLEASIEDDPANPATSNTRGMVSFADRRSANTRTTQLFINLAGMNSYLDEEGYAPVGQIIEGMEVLDSLYNGYGDGSPRGSGPSQAAIQSQGNEYLKTSFPELDYIESASIVE